MSDHSAEGNSVLITVDLIDTLVTAGGYTHHLFADADSSDGRPLPGQAVLLLMGGLVEQSGLVLDAIALLEIGRVQFHKMVRAGSSLDVEVVAGAQKRTSTGKVLQNYTWIAPDETGDSVAEAEVLMLMNETAANGSL